MAIGSRPASPAGGPGGSALYGDYRLALPYWPEARRAQAAAFIDLAEELSLIPVKASDPMVARIRLQWWVETIEGMHHGTQRPGQPVLDALTASAAPLSPLVSLVDEAVRLMEEDSRADRCPLSLSAALIEALIALTPQGQAAIGERRQAMTTLARRYDASRLAAPPAAPVLSGPHASSPQEASASLESVSTRALWSCLTPVPQDLAPVLAPLALTGRYGPGGPPSLFVRRTRLFWVILRGR
ncbi:hypothetical protein PB2503_10369 [Parvularcula bermudensis HTCC2503]|uniref:Phytoene synthase n=1 Tax=Parvularcula bermudensis (strain ATCC BAA-594 / HTCC2503 / KCTC 12087) TaxID=314260 RepID=E0TG06_PARBH|nr:squalene/phytoene synthase family protein [Parvularcula bermudensis]ADM10125.1 hypothetical protein PB2503_10369 [Parvularcula bermudensis HTCC2503]